jgi:hypothetical protein
VKRTLEQGIDKYILRRISELTDQRDQQLAQNNDVSANNTQKIIQELEYVLVMNMQETLKSGEQKPTRTIKRD